MSLLGRAGLASSDYDPEELMGRLIICPPGIAAAGSSVHRFFPWFRLGPEVGKKVQVQGSLSCAIANVSFGVLSAIRKYVEEFISSGFSEQGCSWLNASSC